jgi:hypothetical protein
MLSPVGNGESPDANIWDFLLSFIYTIAHNIGLWTTRLIVMVFNLETTPDSIVDPLGFLMVLTIFFILITLTRKIAWIILIAGWILIAIRIIMIIFKIG